MRSLLFISSIMTLMLSAHSEKTDLKKKISCSIEPMKEKYVMGEHARLKFTVRNNSKSKILLVKALDGSSDGMRSPLAELFVFGPDGKVIPSPILGRCGNTSILNASDFVWIKSGEQADLSNKWLGLHSNYFKKPGKYKIKINYSTMNNDFNKWTGGPMGPEGINKVKQECGDLFQKREKISLSAEVEIEILAKEK